MMKNIVNHAGLLIICLLALTMLGCATGESVTSPTFMDVRPQRVAVVDIRGDIRGSMAKNQVEDFLAMEIMRKGYAVIERSRVQSVIEEQNFQMPDRATEHEGAEIGRILGVPAVMMIDVMLSGEKLSVTSRMVSSQTGEILWIGTGRGGTGRTLATIFGGALGAAGGTQVGAGRGRTIAVVTGGVLGGAAGYALSPQAERMVQRAIKQMVDELPAAR